MSTKIASLFLVLSLLLASCEAVQQSAQLADGAVVAIQPLTALKIIQDAANGCPECFTWVKTLPNGATTYMFAKPLADAWGFVVVGGDETSWKAIAAIGGNAANPKTFSEFVKAIQMNGWQVTTSANIPNWIKETTAFMVSAASQFKYASSVAAEAANSAGALFFVAVPAAAFGDNARFLYPGETIKN